ncbi:Grx4 family monothiol glutaredoxin [Lysobacter sp. HDW10]|jgi:monothiol glutaredoxin|uniref:Grx4 family monothiol glutaredoxin n=1 Tax=Lysobacter sp. HDW10 TaxID=2714936 RepID=UPI0014077858|nr:Grx4 family monothiol glutaredoxin [Lysobacter sp. HDW10]QIK80952.1 Grx4 family monothiol glutaredoxin [Lysobacter sp. HDW10]
MSLEPALRERIESVLRASRVVLFMKGAPEAPQCGFSARAVGMLDSLGLDYAHVDVLADPEIREGIKQFGDWPTIPQLYVDSELVGGSDIIAQLVDSGELQKMLGLAEIDRTPPEITVTASAIDMLQGALRDAGGQAAVEILIDRTGATQLQLAPLNEREIQLSLEGIVFQFDLPSAQRAKGLKIDFVDDERGRGLVIGRDTGIRDITPAVVADRVAAGTLTVVDVRPPEERAIASPKVSLKNIDDGVDALLALPKDTPLAFLCHVGGRSRNMAQLFVERGFSEIYNIEGGTEAWRSIDASIPSY